MNPTSAAKLSTPPVAAQLTAGEFALLHGGENAELVRGQVRELPMPFPKHGKICNTIAYHLTAYALAHDSGHVMTNDSFVQTNANPDSVRGADVCYYSYERLPRGTVPDGLLAPLPDLVVEVKSPSDRWGEMFGKVGEYLQAGVRVVILLDAVTATASVYRMEELQQVLSNGDDLVIPDVLPGFTIPVQRLFT